MESPPLAPARGRITAVAAGAAVALALAGSAVATGYDRPGTATFADTLSFGFVLAAIAVVGAVITLAVPGNRAGWLLLAAGAVMGVGTGFTEAGIHGVVTAPGSVPGAAYLAAAGVTVQARLPLPPRRLRYRHDRVLIVDDHPVFRDGLAGLLATVPGVEVVGSAGSAEEALADLVRTAPDVVLMDINLPGVSGVEATRRALQTAPATAVLVISMVDDDDSVFAALAAGARGYVLKGATAAEITAALATVAAGGAVFGAGIASRMLARAPAPPGGPLAGQDDLTAREREVLDLLAEGASNRQIARALGLSLKTVQNHVSRILDKLQAADRTQAALRARQAGLRPPGR